MEFDEVTMQSLTSQLKGTSGFLLSAPANATVSAIKASEKHWKKDAEKEQKRLKQQTKDKGKRERERPPSQTTPSQRMLKSANYLEKNKLEKKLEKTSQKSMWKKLTLRKKWTMMLKKSKKSIKSIKNIITVAAVVVLLQNQRQQRTQMMETQMMENNIVIVYIFGLYICCCLLAINIFMISFDICHRL